MRSKFIFVTLIVCTSCWYPHVSGFIVSSLARHRFSTQILAVRRRREETDDTVEYWDEERTDPYEESDGPGAYNVYFEGNPYSKEDSQVDWELADDGSTWVCLPPAYVAKPTAVIHFCGGTLFGSSPKLWYKNLLEGVVRASHCAIVATPIPVTLLQNPLNHVQLSRKLQRHFQMAFCDILEDEYGTIDDVPIVGMGHSLGARLMTVLATLAQPKNSAVGPYSSYILISFTNYGASASIPGVRSLLQARRKLDRPTSRGGQRRSNKDNFQGEDDEEWEDFVEEFQETLMEVKDALTPQSQDLEFVPSPDELWNALLEDKRYQIPKTLLVQFDEDDVDQSPRLAEVLSKSNATDIKYAYLHGNHLTPINVDGDDGGGWLQLPTRASKALWKMIRGSEKSSKGEAETMRDVRQSIARYIIDVVTTNAT